MQRLGMSKLDWLVVRDFNHSGDVFAHTIFTAMIPRKFGARVVVGVCGGHSCLSGNKKGGRRNRITGRACHPN